VEGILTPFEPDEEPRSYRCPPAWPRWAVLAGGGAGPPGGRRPTGPRDRS